MSNNKNVTDFFLPFALPDITEDEIAEVVDSLRKGWLTTGPKAKRFEEDFVTFIGKENGQAIAVNSATSGLHLALEAIGIGLGDEVIVPSYTFTATAEVVRYLGGTPVFVDCLPNYNISPSAIEAALTERTKAIIPVHFGGLACDMDSILRIARQHGLRVIEDAAHALPAKYNGELVGSLKSDASVFSFYANKTMTTGEGGMLFTSDPDIAARARVMRLHGINRDAFDRYTSSKPAWFYEVVAPGFKYNMPDLAAAIGIHQLKRLPEFHLKRRAMAERYFAAFQGLPISLPPLPEKDGEHAWHLFPIQILPEAQISRDQFILDMSEQGVGCSVHFIPLHVHPYWRDTYNLKPSNFPVTQRLFDREVSLPLYTGMSDSDLAYVIEAVKKTLRVV